MLPVKHLADPIQPDPTSIYSAFDPDIDHDIDLDINPGCPEPYSPPPFP